MGMQFARDGHGVCVRWAWCARARFNETRLSNSAATLGIFEHFCFI